MPDKIIQWSENKKWVMLTIRAIISTMFVIMVVQIAILFIDVKVMKANRFTKDQGENHNSRLIKLETIYPMISEDIKEIKDLIRNKKIK